MPYVGFVNAVPDQRLVRVTKKQSQLTSLRSYLPMQRNKYSLKEINAVYI